MDVNRTISDIRLMDAFTNNTFDLEKTENAIKSTIENSFQYLKGLQRSYINIHRWNFENKDIYTNDDMIPCVLLNKDFIENTKRKIFKDSKYYTKYFTLDDVVKNRNIFSFIPIVFINGKFVNGYKIKCCLDGTTEIALPFLYQIGQLKEPVESIEVILYKNIEYFQFTTNKFVVEKYNWKLPTSVTKLSGINSSDVVLITIMDSKKKYGSNMIIASVDESCSLILDREHEDTRNMILNSQEVVITVFSSDDLYRLDGNKGISKRIDNDNLSSIVVIEPEDGKTFYMPIPSHNLIVLKRNKQTNSYTYENNLNITLHYPNIYEINCNDFDKENEELIVFYAYRKMNEYLKYTNSFKYIHKYFKTKLEVPTLEKAIRKLLYEELEDTNLQEYFFSIFDYEDSEFIFNNGDFFNTKDPYDFDYKIEKMKEFIGKDPFVLSKYGKSVSTPTENYFLDVRTIDLESRKRMDTSREAEKIDQVFNFGGITCYVFRFRNELADSLDLRFFIDGILCTNLFTLKVKNMDYIYIPEFEVNEDSYIEIEQFYEYTSVRKINLTDMDSSVTIEYSKNENIAPTLFDLFITDNSLHKIDRSKFKIYCLVDKSAYDISDYINNDIHPDTIMEEGEFYVNIENLGYINISTSRIPIKYMILKKIKIMANDESILNMDLNVTVSKVPYIYSETMAINGLPKLKLFNGRVPWKEDMQFVRMFINGRYIPLRCDIYEENPMKTFVIPRCFINEGEVVTVDITPYSYEQEFYLKELPDNFVIDFEGKLSKPFSFDYYDVFLNGRKLNDRNIQIISPSKVVLFNVNSKKNFYILRKDRDCEFFGFVTPMITPIDEVLNSSKVTEEDKKKIIESIIYDNHDVVEEGTNKEGDVEVYDVISDEVFGIYRFYLDIVLAHSVCKPNSVFIDKDVVERIYTSTYERYSNKRNRVVLRPNINHGANTILMLGKRYNIYFPTRLASLQTFIGDETILSAITNKNIVNAVIELFNRLNGIAFVIDETTGNLSAVKEVNETE